MTIKSLERNFYEFLYEHWKLEDVLPFMRSYVDLLLAFRSELLDDIVVSLLERQAQLAVNQLATQSFSQLGTTLREKLKLHAAGNECGGRQEALDRLLFCAFLDTTEPDFFYLVEPIFEFARTMNVDSRLVGDILEKEFPGFKAAMTSSPH